MPLPSSLWMDEAITAFLVQYGPAHPSLAALPALSPIYTALPRLLVAVFGFSEIALRLPSVLATAVALYLLARLAARLIHPQAAWIAAFACLTLRGFNFQATDARPYALGMVVMAAAVWFLVRWLDGSRWWDAALSGVVCDRPMFPWGRQIVGPSAPACYR